MAAPHKPAWETKVPMGIKIHPGIKKWLTEHQDSAISIIESSLKNEHPDLVDYLDHYKTIHTLRQAE